MGCYVTSSRYGDTMAHIVSVCSGIPLKINGVRDKSRLACNLLYKLESLGQGGWRQMPGVRRERPTNGVDVRICRCNERWRIR
ncbi:hypothetical protein Bcep1808_1454 [Burkholderia vietnamiensis G4]|uniref:Uncharacterized protein n=1 Tax=Burkholderia vietnamiensis (strain G4 / LMG 22486) TaxID=269482 RepID=A4JDV9_BURVG|nr:hypothetical protein Bcep1808_1454 [Burkholderia vietnamiensis G4]